MPFLSCEGMLLRCTCAVIDVLNMRRGRRNFIIEYKKFWFVDQG
jgi:hypothetical protein